MSAIALHTGVHILLRSDLLEHIQTSAHCLDVSVNMSTIEAAESLRKRLLNLIGFFSSFAGAVGTAMPVALGDDMLYVALSD